MGEYSIGSDRRANGRPFHHIIYISINLSKDVENFSLTSPIDNLSHALDNLFETEDNLTRKQRVGEKRRQ